MNAIGIMSALAQPTRLAVFSILARAGSEGVTAGELAEQTGTPANTMSAHLTILCQAGLAQSRRAGRNIFYSAVSDRIRQLTMFLIEECCDGGGDICQQLQSDLDACIRARSAGRTKSRGGPGR